MAQRGANYHNKEKVFKVTIIESTPYAYGEPSGETEYKIDTGNMSFADSLKFFSLLMDNRNMAPKITLRDIKAKK